MANDNWSSASSANDEHLWKIKQRGGSNDQRRDRQTATAPALRVLFVTEGTETNSLADYFRSAGLIVDIVSPSHGGPSATECSTYDALLMHQSESGRGHHKRLIALMQGRDCPGILILASSLNDVEKVAALELGADDYQDAACQPRELLARIRAVARRRPSRFMPAPSLPIENGSEPKSGYSFGGWLLDVWNGRITSPAGTSIRLTMSEVKILMAIVSNPHSVLTRNHLTKVLGRFDADGSYRPIDLFVSRLRKKLAAYDATEIIVTERGSGYAYNQTLGRVDTLSRAA